LNRAHYRSFSVNIFLGNADELAQVLGALNDDPIEHWKTISSDLEASHKIQTHVGRLFHNFLASAMTLVDHTRVFIKEFYLATALSRTYNERKRVFEGNNLTRFIQDLRNYMVHRGLPPIRRMLSFKQVEGAAPQTEGKGIPVTGDSYFDLEVEPLLR
jgi:hypothetical protein